MDTNKIQMLTMVAQLHDMMDAMGNPKASSIEDMQEQIKWLTAIHKLLDVADAIRAKGSA